MYNYQQGTLPPFFENFFISTNAVHNYSTNLANSNSFRPIRCNKANTKKSIRFKAPSHWNQLPMNIKSATKTTFKKEYKNYVFSSY